MRLRFEDWSSHLQQGTLAPYYLVFGEEVLLVQESVESLRSLCLQLGFDEVERWVLEPGFDWSALLESGAALSLFATRKVIHITTHSADLINETGAKVLSQLIQDSHPDQVLILQIYSKLDKKHQGKAWYKAIEKNGVALPVWPLSRQKLPSWIQNRANQLGIHLTPSALRLVIERTEGNLLATFQALSKVALVHQGTADVDHFEDSMGSSQRYDIFALMEACIEANPKRALQILANIWEEGVEPVLMLWALNREIRLLVQLRAISQDQWQKLGVWPRKQRFYNAALNRITLPQMDEHLKRVAILDRMIKGQVDASIKMALEHMVLELSGAQLPTSRSFWAQF